MNNKVKFILTLFLLLVTYLPFSNALSKFFAFLNNQIIFTADVENVAPKVENIFISSKPFALNDDHNNVVLTPKAFSTRNIHFNGIAQDLNGAEDIKQIQAVFYRSGVDNGFNCSNDVHRCYYGTCTWNALNGTDIQYSCTINLTCYLNPTTTPPFHKESWKIYLAAIDSSNARGEYNYGGIAVVPHPELCNDIDDNCNGEINEGLFCGGVIPINPKPPVIEPPVIEPPTPEKRPTDKPEKPEQPPSKPSPDTPEPPISEQPSEQPTETPPTQLPPITEPTLCDDEDIFTCGIGVCAISTPNCINGYPAVCIPNAPTELVETTCNDGLDNDCNGVTDIQDPSCTNDDIDHDNVINDIDQCPKVTGRTEYFGCPFAYNITTRLQIVDLNQTGACEKNAGFLSDQQTTCEKPFTGVNVKFFDRESFNFLQEYHAERPDRDLFNDIYKSEKGLVGECTTDQAGQCLVGLENRSKLLAISSFYDTENNLIVYHGRFINFNTNINAFLPEKDDDDILSQNNEYISLKVLRFIKFIDDTGEYYRAGKRLTLQGSVLHIDIPEYTPKEQSIEFYPFIFSSDSKWDADICLDLPQEVVIDGIRDENNKQIGKDKCQSLTINNSSSVILAKIKSSGNTYNIGLNINTSHINEQGEKIEQSINEVLKTRDIEAKGIVDKNWVREIMILEEEKLAAIEMEIWLEFWTRIIILLAILSIFLLLVWRREQENIKITRFMVIIMIVINKRNTR